MTAGRCVGAVAMAIGLAGCGAEPPAGVAVSGGLIESPGPTAASPDLVRLIEAADPVPWMTFLEKLNELDARPLPPGKGEFETTADYEKRLAQSAPRPYGPGCYAFVEQGDFAYDADREQARFFSRRSLGPPQTTHAFEAIRIEDSAGAAPAPLAAPLPIERARRLDHASGVRIVRIFSLSGQPVPAVSGWIHPDPFDDLNPLDTAKFKGALERIRAREYTLRARLIAVRVFTPETGYAQPLFSWAASSDRC